MMNDSPNDPTRLMAALQADQPSALAAWCDAELDGINTFLAHPKVHGDEHWLPLHEAAQAGARRCVAWLLTQGAAPDSRTRYRTPMHARQTALHLAAQAGQAEILTELLQAGGTALVLDAQGNTPLHLAAQAGRRAAAEALLDARLLPDRPDDAGRSAVHRLIQGPDDKRFEELDQRVELLSLLLDRGADVNARCPKEPQGFTPLHRCVALGSDRLPLAQRLMERGADLSLADPATKHTPAQLAQTLGQQDYIALLA